MTVVLVPGGLLPAAGPMLLPLTEVSDRNRNNWTIAYDEAGVPAAVDHSGGYHLTLGSHEGRITALHVRDATASDQPGSTIRTFDYDDAGDLTGLTNSSGLPHRFTYDADRRITSWADRNDTTYAYTYDQRGRCVATHGSDGFLDSTFAYDDDARTTTFTDSLGRQRTSTHNAAYRLIAETDPLGNTTTQQWDPANRHLTGVTDPLGNTTSYAYDDAGNPVRPPRPPHRQTATRPRRHGPEPHRLRLGRYPPRRANRRRHRDQLGLRPRHSHCPDADRTHRRRRPVPLLRDSHRRHRHPH